MDADPATSQGVFVFTGAAAVRLWRFCRVTGTVTEFVSGTDTLQPPETRIAVPTAIVPVGVPQPLPAAVQLTATFPDPAGPVDQMERVEGMRVRVPSLTVTAPGEGTLNEPSATATATGVFHGVVTGLPRPVREPGIRAPDPRRADRSRPSRASTATHRRCAWTATRPASPSSIPRPGP